MVRSRYELARSNICIVVAVQPERTGCPSGKQCTESLLIHLRAETLAVKNGDTVAQ